MFTNTGPTLLSISPGKNRLNRSTSIACLKPRTKSLTALKIAKEYLADAVLKAEAEVAIYKIAGLIFKDYPDETKKILMEVLKSTTNEQVRKEAQKIINWIDEKNDKK